MKLALRIVAFTLCLAATYSAASFTAASTSNPKPTAPIPTCGPSNPSCSMLK